MAWQCLQEVPLPPWFVRKACPWLPALTQPLGLTGEKEVSWGWGLGLGGALGPLPSALGGDRPSTKALRSGGKL